MEGSGVNKVDVDFSKKTATVRYDAGQTTAASALARLTAKAKYSKSAIEGLHAQFEGEYVKLTAVGAVKGGKTRKGKLFLTLEPKGDHALNGAGQPDLEIEAKAKDGVTFKTPLTKDKKGVAKKPRELALDFEADGKLPAGEIGIELELRLMDVVGKDAKPRTIQVVVPVLLP